VLLCSGMSRHLFPVFAFAVAFSCLGQTPATLQQPLPKDPRAILEMAAPHYDFTSPDLKPWHLKATYQLYDDQGKPTEQGTYEYWWASPKSSRASWTRAGASRTEWSMPDGSVYLKQTGGPLHYFEKTIEHLLFSPVPFRELLDNGKVKLDLKMLPAKPEKITCVTASHELAVNGQAKPPVILLPDYYCFAPSTPALVLTDLHSITTEFNQLVKTQDRYLPKRISVLIGRQKVFDVSIDEIGGLNPAESELAPPPDAKLESTSSDPSGPVRVASNLAAGGLVKKAPPNYPLFAKANRIQGTVILAGTIGTDGRLRDLEVLATPSPVLEQAALDSVKKWEYKPYLLNGKPVEVETLVNVVFALGN